MADRHRGITTFVTTISGRGGHSSAPRPGVNAIALAARFVIELEDVGRQLSVGRSETGDRAPEHTTINVGRIEGGTAVNMIAERCRLSWECRPEAGSTAADIVAAVEGRLAPFLRLLRDDCAGGGDRDRARCIGSAPGRHAGFAGGKPRAATYRARQLRRRAIRVGGGAISAGGSARGRCAGRARRARRISLTNSSPGPSWSSA